MKKKLITAALLMGMSALLPACKDETPAAPEAPAAPAADELLQLPVEEAAPTAPDREEVRNQLLPQLADYAGIQFTDVQMDATPSEDGSVAIAARVLLQVSENFYAAEEAPASFNEERKEINDALNRAMLPDAHYLLQAGATAESLTDADRAAQALPEELQKTADELRLMASRTIYRLRIPAQTTIETPATLTAALHGERWEFSNISLDTEPLQAMLSLIPEATLPQGATIVAKGEEAKLHTALREKIEAFNRAAEPYIASREETAHKRIAEAQAREEEKAKAAEDQKAQQAARLEAWEAACNSTLKDGALFEGEWKRGDAFGKFSLRVSRVQRFPDSLQFVGTLSDTDLPQAELQIVGRCEAAAKPGDPIPCIVRLYNGRYDPDVATAEVFDAQDGVLRLTLDADGALNGVMTCESWGSSSDKAFDVRLHHMQKKAARRTQAR